MSTVTNRLAELELTDATRYVLPMLGSIDRDSSFFITKNFENCYIGDANHTELGRRIYLLYHYRMNPDFVRFEHKIELIPEYSTDFDYADEHEVMYVFNIPNEHKEDFEKFLNGDFNSFSDTLKTKIRTFWGKDLGDFLGMEWPKPVLTKEIYMNPS